MIEAVVATSVFAFFITSILGVYMSTLRLDSRTRAQRAVTDNARFIMEFLAKEVRNGRIDYDASGCNGTSNDTDLCIINQSNEAEHIYVENVGDLNGGRGTNLVIEKGAGTSNLNSSSVTVTKLKFLVSPSSDPFTGGSNEQPHVTVIMQLTAQSNRDPVKLDIQTTLSENYYPIR